MKLIQTMLAAAGGAAVTIMAQALLTMGAASAETVPAATAPANIGIIDSSTFTDEKTGIARVVTALKQLDARFQPHRNELRGMHDRLTKMRSDISTKRAIQDASMTARQVEEADALELQIKRKAEDAKSSYEKEQLAVLEPLQRDVVNGLSAYAQAKGVTLVFDANRVPIIYADPSLDITRAFVTEYNRTHPAGGAPPPARPAPPPARPAPSPARPAASPARPARP